MVKKLARSLMRTKPLILTVIIPLLLVSIIILTAYRDPTVNFFKLNLLDTKQLFWTKCHKPRFSAVNLPATGLVSFPGSGNTWLRYLVQEASGILTGSEYNDIDLLQGPFPAEGITNSSTILVKTHGSDDKTRDRYSRVILLIRHPKDAILAEFNRNFGEGHRAVGSTESFLKYWKHFSKVHANAWYSFHSDWLTYKKPLLIVRYEDLVSQPVLFLQRVSSFLEIPVTSLGIKCAIYNGKQFKRSHTTGSQLAGMMHDSKMIKHLNKIYLAILSALEDKLAYILSRK